MRLMGLAILMAVAPMGLAAEEFRGYMAFESCAKKGQYEGKAHRQCGVSVDPTEELIVFVQESDKKIFRIDDEYTAQGFLGKRVRVTGTKDGDDFIEVDEIKKG